MEDLWAFNEEPVVRAIYASRIPIISAVGHETDYTLADFAGDVRAATPSQAAELAVPDTLEQARYVMNLQVRLAGAAKVILQAKRNRLTTLVEHPSLRVPQQLLQQRRQHVDMARERLLQKTREGVLQKKHNLAILLEKLDMLNPARVLLRGYSIVEKDGKAVRQAAELQKGMDVQVRLADGSFSAVVTEVNRGGMEHA